jgi:probable HAF family extracellular repeat protein/VCBS repeat-containing protein
MQSLVVRWQAVFLSILLAVALAAPLTAHGQMTDLGSLSVDPDGYGRNYATAINNSGQVTGNSEAYDTAGNYKGTRAFLYNNGQMTDLGSLGTDTTYSSTSTARAINDSGQVTGYSETYDYLGTYKGIHAFLYSNGQMIDLGTFGVRYDGYSYSEATAINNSGQVTGYSDVYDTAGNYKGTRAFLYSGNGQMTDLGSLGVDRDGYGYSIATAINDSGQVTGYSDVYDATGNFQGVHSFITGAIGTNHAPVAVNDVYNNAEDTPLSVPAASGVLSNDTDTEGQQLTAKLVEGPAHGTLTLNANGSFTYTPAANYHGPDTFTYKVNDGTADSNVATVTITMDAVNDAPVAVDDAVVTGQDTSVTILVLNNDTDVDGDKLTVIAVTSPAAGGTATINPNGTITYVPPANFQGTDSFAYTVSDGSGGTATASVTVTVNPVNHAPDAVPDAGTTALGTPVTIAVLQNDTDIDQDPARPTAATHTVTVTTQPRNGTAVVNANGTVTYTPRSNFTGTDGFIYILTDSGGLSDTATVMVTVGQSNNPPRAVDDSAATMRGVAVPIPVLANDSDRDGDPIQVVSFSVPNPANGRVTNDGSGTLIFTPAPGFQGRSTFTYTISDGRGGTDTARVVVRVL